MWEQDNNFELSLVYLNFINQMDFTVHMAFPSRVDQTFRQASAD
jgi:hypothetical protein